MPLTPLQHQILSHTAQSLGATTIGALQRQPFFAGKTRAAVKSAVRRLCGTSKRYRQPPRRYRYLAPEPLDERRVIYRLTPRATRLLGVSDYLAKPLGLQARIRRYALIWFLCIEGTVDNPQGVWDAERDTDDRCPTDESAASSIAPCRRVPFSPRDFPAQFDVARHHAPRKNFYVEQAAEGRTRIGFIVLDHGRDPRRVYRNASQSLLRFVQRGWLDDFLTAGCFDLTVLTVSEGKRAELELGLDKQLRAVLTSPLRRLGRRPGDPLPFRVRVLVVPGLADLIPGSQTQ